MTEREAAVNRDLRALDDAHRLGQIARAEYRARRRNVLARLADAEAATERNPVQGLIADGEGATVKKPSGDPATAKVGPARLRDAPPPAAVAARKPGAPLVAIVLLSAGLIVLAIAAWLLWLRPPAASAPAVAPAVRGGESEVAPAADAKTAFEREAQRAIADDRWDVATLDGLAANWLALDAAARAELRGRPAYVQLRQQLQRRRKVVDLLLEGAAADDPKLREAASLKALDAALAMP